MNSNLLSEMVGKKVQVYSVHGGGEVQTVGTLESVDDLWVKIRKSETEVMYFGVAQVRMVKNFL
jgi:hypothetical protein